MSKRNVNRNKPKAKTAKPKANSVTAKEVQGNIAAPKAIQDKTLSPEAMQAAGFPFTRKNYRLMIGGVLTIALGFVLMSMDSEPHGFGFMGLKLGPVVTFAGFMLEIVAILWSDKK